MSPVQYQKALQPQEARRLMVSETMDADEASRRVGYASTSQFSREYGRFFGSARRRHLEVARTVMVVAVVSIGFGCVLGYQIVAESI
jgi:AraC-like DNA-binding protein